MQIPLKSTYLLIPITALATVSLPSLANQIDLADLSLQQLSDIRVTTVSKHAEQLLAAPAAVYVISRDDIRRSGITSIPEALRLAPGVQVARNGSHSWAISIRGFNSELSNKLLVLIDGRSVYSPLYAGVFWDAQDTLLEDVDRIEVVSGPGGTLWGANAVNGVINIITRSAKETEGGYLAGGGGNEERGFGAFRYSAQLDPDTALRGYLKYKDQGPAQNASGNTAHDDWRMSQAGFRFDHDVDSANLFTLQGDIYSGKEGSLFRDDFTMGTLPGPSFTGDVDIGGGNFLGRWEQRQDENSDMRVLLYYDYTRREIINTYNEERDTINLDFQSHSLLGTRNDIVWGAAFRLTSDQLDNSLFATFEPAERTDRTYSFFLQDKIDLWQQQVFLTLGSKFEYNNYTDFEMQPNARLSWTIGEHQTAWASVSRAVRIPSRLESDLHLTAPVAIPGLPFAVYVQVDGNDEFDSEKLIAYEAGYRIQALDTLSFDISTFYNDYDELMSTEPETPVIVPHLSSIYILLPNRLANGMRGEASGGTLSAQWQAHKNWRMQLHYSYFNLQLNLKPGSQDQSARTIEGNTPEHQLSLFSFVDLPHNVGLYTAIRHVDHIESMDLPSYIALDISLNWEVSKALELSLVGQNLTDSSHQEFDDRGGVEVERSIFGKATYRF